MEWKTTWNDPLTSYLAPYHDLIGDKRTRTTFDETIRGMMGAGSLICQQIAVHSPVLATAKKGAQRIIRLASGESTQRWELDAAHLTKQLRKAVVEHLGQAPEEELWLAARSLARIWVLRRSRSCHVRGRPASCSSVKNWPRLTVTFWRAVL